MEKWSKLYIFNLCCILLLLFVSLGSSVYFTGRITDDQERYKVIANGSYVFVAVAIAMFIYQLGLKNKKAV